MVGKIDRPVNSVPIQKNPDRPQSATRAVVAAPRLRRRLGVAERERQILDGAIQFFADKGLDGQLRDLASSIGVTHALLYHYFPTKQALIDRVYLEVFEGRWQPEWETLLDDPARSPEDKLTAFYAEYVDAALTQRRADRGRRICDASGHLQLDIACDFLCHVTLVSSLAVQTIA